VIRQLLQNPRLTENDVVRMVARRPARLEVLEALADHGRWFCRPRVRLAVLFNPGSPATICMPLLAVCTRSELTSVLHHCEAAPVLRSAARELLERLPPLPEQPEPEAPPFTLQ